jgi:hypothetical protein
VARIGSASLRGYILEESLAYLVRQSGYSLLVSPAQDPDALASRGNGLVVRGRGADHQVDVLGELDWTPSFTFPLRLFLEAKSHSSKIGIQAVRNAVGVLTDVNQRNVQAVREPLTRRFRYAYALVSTSGFSGPAANMAFAHEVSLVDLSGPEYLRLRTEISRAAESLVRAEPALSITETEAEVLELEELPSIVARVRDTMRVDLGTDPQVLNEAVQRDEGVSQQLSGVLKETREIGNLFVGMAAGPYMLLLHARGREAFVLRMLENPVLSVRVSWSRDREQGRTWEITPADEGLNFSLTFRLPEALAEWIFNEKGGTTTRALRVKTAMLPHIFIPFRDERQVDHLFRLDYVEPGTG